MAKSKKDAPKARKSRANGKHGNGQANGHDERKGALSDDELQALHFRHVGEYEKALEAKKGADAEMKNVGKRIKSEGGTVKAVKLTILLRTEEGQAAFHADIAEQMRVAEWNGIGVQTEMFGAATADRDPIFEDGKRAAMQDEPCKPPEHLAHKAAQRWIAGHGAGRVATNAQRATDGFHKFGDVAADIMPPPVGTEAPTHVPA